MYKLIVLFALVAVAFANPGFLGARLAPAYVGYAAAPVAYAAPAVAAPVAYATPAVAAPLAAAPLAYSGIGYGGVIAKSHILG